MSAPMSVNPPQILLVEPDNLIRGTLASVCRDLGLARIHQTINVSAAMPWLENRDLHAMLIALDPEGTALNLLSEVRAGQFACHAGLAVAVMASECTVETAKTMKALDVKRILLRPFKLRDAILTLELLAAELAPAPSAPQPEKLAAEGEAEGSGQEGTATTAADTDDEDPDSARVEPVSEEHPS